MRIRSLEEIRASQARTKATRRAARARKYGLTVVELDALWAYQKHRCAICKTVLRQGTGGHTIDHDHASCKVRGLLCTRCNSIEGLIRATGLTPEEVAKRLDAYLQDPPAGFLDLA